MNINASGGKSIPRTTVQVLAFAIFIFQMQNSVKKFVEKPIVQISSTKDIDDIKMPIIYVCQDSQFDYEMSKSYGYEWIENYFSGILSGSSKISFSGKHDNVTFWDLFHKLYIHDTSSFNAENYNPEDSDLYEWKKLSAVKVAINPYGYCMKLNQSRGSTYFSSTQKSIFLIVDPQADNLMQISHLENGYGELGPTANGKYDYFSYDMDISLYDSSILVDQACTDYDATGYTDCLFKVMEERLLKWYGCLIPMFAYNESLLCNENKEILVSNESRKEIMQEFNRLAIGQEFKSFESCLPPCVTMSIKLKQLKHVTNNPNAAGVRIDMNKKTVNVYILAISYDVFNLVVDLGSALGLWFGLSAISIYDTIIEVIVIIFKKNCNRNHALTSF